MKYEPLRKSFTSVLVGKVPEIENQLLFKGKFAWTLVITALTLFPLLSFTSQGENGYIQEVNWIRSWERTVNHIPYGPK